MSEDADLGPLAKQDLEKIDLSLADVMSKASRVLLPGRSFDANNAQLEVQAGKLFPNNFLNIILFLLLFIIFFL
jgi:protein subunit release factor A